MSTVSDDLVVDIPRSRIAVASMVGTTVEFYDFYVYATAEFRTLMWLPWTNSQQRRFEWLLTCLRGADR
jgi:uncharacterized protein (DUF2236 family)